MKADERTWETSGYTVENNHVTVLSLQPCAGSTDHSPFIIWSTLLCKHTSGPFNLRCQNTHFSPHKLGGLWNGNRTWVHLNLLLSLCVALFFSVATSWPGLIIPKNAVTNQTTTMLSSALIIQLYIYLTRVTAVDFTISWYFQQWNISCHLIMVGVSKCPLWPPEPCCRGQFAPGRVFWGN